jgi:hypothetical protein
MSKLDAIALSDLLSAQLAVPAWLALGVAALIVVFSVIALRARSAGKARRLWTAAGFVIAVLASVAAFDWIARSEQAAERRALLAREAELSHAALAPGSALACLDATAGESIEAACEKAVFATAQSAAGAIAYMDARLKILAAAAGSDDPHVRAALASTRRAIALDRFGVAAHVLAMRDGCTASDCAAFALVDDANVLKGNMKAQVFEQYVSRYVARWTAPPAEKAPAVAAAPAEQPAPLASIQPGGAPLLKPVKPGEPWDYPSADDIPAVSIMDKEPPRPKEAAVQAEPAAQASAAPPAAASSAAAAPPPVPPQRPQQKKQQTQQTPQPAAR